MKISLRQKFILIQMTYWCSICSMFVFIAAYLYNLGYTPLMVGIALALQKIFGFIGQILWASLSRHKREIKRNFIIGNICLLVVFMMIYRMNLPWIVIFAIGFSGLFESAMPTLLDTWILKSYPKNPEIYGSIRSSASFAFAWFAIFMGQWVRQIGFIVMPFASFILVTMTVMIAISIKVETQLSTSTLQPTISVKHQLGHLLGNSQYVIILVAMLFYGICSLPFNLALPILIQSSGGSIAVIGYATFANAMSQFPMMLMYRKYAWINPYILLQIALLLTILAYLTCLIFDQTEAIIIAQVFSGLGFGILLPTLRNMIFKLVDPSDQTLSQSIVDLIQISLAGIIGNVLVGWMIEVYSVSTVLISFIIILIGAEFVLTIGYLHRNEDHNATKEITDRN